VIHQSAGGINGSISDQYASYTGAMLNAAKSISKSVVKIGESVLGYSGQQANNANLAEKSSPPKQAMLPTMNTNASNAPRLRHGSGKDEPQAGIVTVIDTVKFFGVRSPSRSCRTRRLISSRHLFMTNDKTGSLLIFKLIQNPSAICSSIQVDTF
jgi:hypothetical protein